MSNMFDKKWSRHAEMKHETNAHVIQTIFWNMHMQNIIFKSFNSTAKRLKICQIESEILFELQRG